MNYREVDITKSTNHFITGVEGGLVCFQEKNIYPSQSKKIFYFALCKKNISLKPPTKNCVQKYIFNQKRSEESSRNVCSADLEDSNGKEELYLRKTKQI